MSTHPAQGMTPAQIANMYNNQWYAQQGVHLQMANRGQTYNANTQLHMWVWNGVPMNIVDFAHHAYGDTPEATHFILKYKEIA